MLHPLAGACSCLSVHPVKAESEGQKLSKETNGIAEVAGTELVLQPALNRATAAVSEAK